MRAVAKNINFVFCSFFPVGLEDYVDYFKSKFIDFHYLKWKFPHSQDKRASSLFLTYFKGSLSHEKKIFYFSAHAGTWAYFILLPISYLVYFFQAIYYLGLSFPKKKRAKTVFMGINYFCTFCGIILKKMGKVDFVIYRVMDFFPLPPKGIYRRLNRFFYVLDKYCLKNSDAIWFTTEGHLIGREKYGYFNRKDYDYKMIPLGIDLNKFISLPVNDMNRYSLVYCGVVSRYQLLDLVFEVVKKLKIRFKKIQLKVIGSGPDIEYFKDLAQKMGLGSNIIFYGFMEDSAEFRKLMADNVLGIALYKDEENYMKYTEPAKVKHYLTFGIPAIVSDVPVIAKEIDRQKVGFAVNNDADEIAAKIEKFIASPEMQSNYKKNIRRFIKTVDINHLLDLTFIQTPGLNI